MTDKVTIYAEMFAVVPHSVVDMKLSHYAIALYTVLARFANREGYCFPSMDTLAEFMRVSKRNIYDALNELQESGALVRYAPEVKGRGYGNSYQLLMRPQKVTNAERLPNQEAYQKVTKSVPKGYQKVSAVVREVEEVLEVNEVEEESPSSEAELEAENEISPERLGEIRRALMGKLTMAYKRVNGKPMPNVPAVAKQVSNAIVRLHGWTLDEMAKCVDNRFRSDVNHAESPAKWLPRLEDYASGALDRFGKLPTAAPVTKPTTAPFDLKAIEATAKRDKREIREAREKREREEREYRERCERERLEFIREKAAAAKGGQS